jgi:hypothetical protein
MITGIAMRFVHDSCLFMALLLFKTMQKFLHGTVTVGDHATCMALHA